MGVKVKDLCRLCAKKHKLSKDLQDESNKSILDLIQQYTQIAVLESENLPTRVCLDCEEKLISFQLFILECYKAQDYFMKSCLRSSENVGIKVEESGIALPIPEIKSEVKDELTSHVVQDLLTEVNEVEDSIDKYEEDYYPYAGNAEDSNAAGGEEDEDDWDNLTLASLKQSNTKFIRKKDEYEDNMKKLDKVLKNPDFGVKDIIKLQCSFCELRFKSYMYLYKHSTKLHKSKPPLVYCLCGVSLHNKSAIYKHLVQHKQECGIEVKEKERLPEKPERGPSDPSKRKIKDFIDFKCNTCDKCCTSWYTLKGHCERIHKVDPIVQCTCGVVIKSKTVMYKHVQDHKNPSSLSCDLCSKILKSAAALSKHKLRHVPKTDRQFCCQSCDKVFNNRELLKSHEKSHIPIDERKIYNCDICNLKFTTASSARSHKRVVHEKVKAYVCDLCGYACGTNGELRQHRAIHSDEKPFVCRKCPKRFKTYSNLKTHMDTHGDTSYVCYVCNRVLNSRRTLRKHLLVHEDKCRHVCSYCNKAFKRRQTLKVHMYTHTGDKPLSCKWCDERFSYASTLRSHRLRCHPDKMNIIISGSNPGPGTLASYTTYHGACSMPAQDYIKSDLAAIGVTKNEVEVTI